MSKKILFCWIPCAIFFIFLIPEHSFSQTLIYTVYPCKGKIFYKDKKKWIVITKAVNLDENTWIKLNNNESEYLLKRNLNCAIIKEQGIQQIKSIILFQCNHSNPLMHFLGEMQKIDKKDSIVPGVQKRVAQSNVNFPVPGEHLLTDSNNSVYKNNQYTYIATPAEIDSLNNELTLLNSVKDNLDEYRYLLARASVYNNFKMYSEVNKIYTELVTKYNSDINIKEIYSDFIERLLPFNSNDNIANTPLQILSPDNKKIIAVLPFISAAPEYKNRALQLQDFVVAYLSKKDDVILIDKSKDALLLRELNNQINEQSISVQNLVQQGKLIGAQNIITGTLSSIGISQENRTTKNLNGTGDSTTTIYEANIAFSLQLIDVETGSIISQRSFNSNDKTGLFSFGSITTGSSKDDALSKAMAANQKQIQNWISQHYSWDIKILKIEERDKHGLPDVLLISGIDNSLGIGTNLGLNEIGWIDAGDGKQLKRSLLVASLKIVDKQGDISVCKITDGEKNIESKIKSNAKFEIVVK